MKWWGSIILWSPWNPSSPPRLKEIMTFQVRLKHPHFNPQTPKCLMLGQPTENITWYPSHTLPKTTQLEPETAPLFGKENKNIYIQTHQFVVASSPLVCWWGCTKNIVLGEIPKPQFVLLATHQWFSTKIPPSEQPRLVDAVSNPPHHPWTPKPWKMKVLHPKIWVITPKNEGFGFPWHSQLSPVTMTDLEVMKIFQKLWSRSKLITWPKHPTPWWAIEKNRAPGCV